MKKKNFLVIICIMLLILILLFSVFMLKKHYAIKLAYKYLNSIEEFYSSDEYPDIFRESFEGTRTVQEISYLKDKSLFEINVKEPKNGWVKIENGKVNECSLEYNNYIINCDGKNLAYVKNGNLKNKVYSMSDVCPGCVFRYSNEPRYIAGDDNNPEGAITFLESSEYTNDYKLLNKQFFLGHIIDLDGSIQRSFVCGIENNVPFCLEGGINEKGAERKPIYEKNVDILNSIFKRCETHSDNNLYSCDPENWGFVEANTNGEVHIAGDDTCDIDSDGAYCWWLED